MDYKVKEKTTVKTKTMDTVFVNDTPVTKISETKHTQKILKEFETMETELKRQKTEVDTMRKDIQTVVKQNQPSHDYIFKELDDLRIALEQKDKLLRSAHDENFLLESDRDNLDEKIIKLKAEIEEKDATIMKLRHKIKKFDKFREEMLTDNKKTREELTGKLDNVTGELEFIRGEFKFMHSAMNELLTGARKENNKKKQSGWNNSPNTHNTQNAKQKKKP
ncbi:Hypothetical predicted protein [Mytilus galloprovincialis]|uniref:Uncharacterized protein n=2 Tax=Mytilus galloprovincialis TaxID=29158 RepID=A0A8B6DHB4_MYTGA|nr:Hypothetical predicted protein [Mytilus galloprovincialis]